MQKIAISAAEPSGDLLGAKLISAFATDDVNFFGLAGQKMQSSGCDKCWDIDQVSVMGFLEVMKKLPSLLRLRQRIIRHFIAEKPACFISIDAPDFNFFIAKKLKKYGIKTVHFVSPSLWAWRARRIKKIKKSVDMMLCVFPFEVDFYQQHQMRAVFVGHPLAQQLQARTHYQKTQQILLMPGSRASEIKRLLPEMLLTSQKILKQQPQMSFVITLVNKQHLHWVNNQLSRYQLPINISVGDAQTQLKQSDLVLIASGTATLEAMIIGVPMVIVYKLSLLTYYLIKPFITSPWVGLPNILAQQNIVPELLQHQANANNISRCALTLLQSDNRPLLDKFKQLSQSLRLDSNTLIRKHIFETICNNP